MPPRITRIEAGVFYKNTNLFTLTLPNTVEIIYGSTNIDDATFGNALSEIIISEDSMLRQIISAAFSGSMIKSIFIPQYLTSMDTSPFLYCKLENIIIDPRNQVLKTDGKTIYKDNNATIYIVSAYFSGEYTVPSFVTKLFGQCFRGVPITNIIFPNHSIEMNNFCFGDTNIVNFEFSSGITRVPLSFFSTCRLLKSVNLSESIKSIESYAFNGCYALDNITFPSKLEIIDDYAFQSCISLKKLVFPPALREIGQSVFKSCNLEIDTDSNDNFLYVNHMLFSNNKSFLTESFGTDINTALTIPIECVSIGKNTFWKKDLKKVTFAGSSVISINETAFSQSKIVEIYFPSSLQTLGNGCFMSCSLLTTASFSGTSIKSIPDDCFRDCTKLTDIVLLSSITSIGSYSFYNCVSIGDIGIRDTQVSKIGRYSFSFSGLTTFESSNCLSELLLNSFESSSVSRVSICSNNIPDGCFHNCTNLVSLTLHEGIVTLSSTCFKGCTKLESFTIPSTTTTINSFAFQGCSSLSSVTLSQGSVLREVFGGAFADCDLLESIICNSASHTFRNGALMDADESNLIVFIPSSKITTFIVPSTMKTIGQYAFMGSRNLIRVICNGDTLTTIGFMSLTNCVSLSFLYVSSSSLTTIGDHAFDGCPKLRKCGSVQCMKNKRNMFIEKDIPSISFIEVCSNYELTCKMQGIYTFTFLQSTAVFILMYL
ncbi:Leucine Rich Repeat family protein [Trichomonas vaginalis G3]|uniref:Leucine Rich Repeat family protein n=1 Tax=Trichomonas vaginalis (strain ATCC PRA-98 / G3) TaxID=412133 RepID=A2E860_TRIV3|nr:uncharacterized protein TVAGG3_0973800 [Trichomonas vaginalis G3]EAY11178.1 Leucine Rich Repeat family protein [Trichomonas vaginalis G3]KAI5488773.1 structural constituent of cell wall [Trichomonas vaginalis G3]|eukprot:XP_001323401.1 hypothetical protein [Trichomonas vaginalis G3]